MPKIHEVTTIAGLIAAFKSGESIHLHKAKYKGNFTSQSVDGVVGTEQGAVLEGVGSAQALTIKGQKSTYQGLEVIKGGGVYVHAPETKLHDLVVHDAVTSGIGLWADSPDSEIAHCIIYRNGRDNIRDHGIYNQNKTGIQRLVDNILFDNASHGIHTYGSAKAFLKGFHIEGNISFNNGSKLRKFQPNIHVGGHCPASRVVVQNNFTYHAGPHVSDVRMGFSNTNNDDLEMFDNYFAGVLRVKDWKQFRVMSNTVVADHIEWFTDRLKKPNQVWDKNSYYLRDAKPFWITEKGKRRKLSFTEWQKQTGFDHASASYSGTPPNQVFVRRVGPSKVHVVVYNWAKQATVALDLNGALAQGVKFTLRNVENLSKPLVEGSFDDKPLKFSVGEFGCFVVEN